MRVLIDKRMSERPPDIGIACSFLTLRHTPHSPELQAGRSRYRRPAPEAQTYSQIYNHRVARNRHACDAKA